MTIGTNWKLAWPNEALNGGLPLLAICRGMQLFNVARGGTLIQHLPSTETHRVKKAGDEPGRHSAAHTVRVAGGTQLASIMGEGEHAVNSRHHQAVDRLGDGLVVSAVSSDGVIEAMEMPAHPFAVAVQWHPGGSNAGLERGSKAVRGLRRSAARITGSLGRTDVAQDRRPSRPAAALGVRILFERERRIGMSAGVNSAARPAKFQAVANRFRPFCLN